MVNLKLKKTPKVNYNYGKFLDILIGERQVWLLCIHNIAWLA